MDKFQAILIFAILVFMLVSAFAFGFSALFANGEGGVLDYLTGNSLTRDKATWEAERKIEAERARQAEARADQEQERTAQLGFEKDIAIAKADEASALERAEHWKTEQIRAEGDKAIDVSVAQALTLQSRMQPMLIVVLSLALPLAGIGLANIADYLSQWLRGRGI